jgi:hypothetical protein
MFVVLQFAQGLRYCSASYDEKTLALFTKLKRMPKHPEPKFAFRAELIDPIRLRALAHLGRHMQHRARN